MWPFPAQEGLILLVCPWGPWLCAPQQRWLFSPAAKKEKIRGAGRKAAEYCRGFHSLQWTLQFLHLNAEFNLNFNAVCADGVCILQMAQGLYLIPCLHRVSDISVACGSGAPNGCCCVCATTKACGERKLAELWFLHWQSSLLGPTAHCCAAKQ